MEEDNSQITGELSSCGVIRFKLQKAERFRLWGSRCSRHKKSHRKRCAFTIFGVLVICGCVILLAISITNLPYECKYCGYWSRTSGTGLMNPLLYQPELSRLSTYCNEKGAECLLFISMLSKRHQE